jgi:hypothetical protein
MIAALITQHRGEYVLRIGEQPPRAQLFAGGLSDDTDGWSGVPRTVQELDLLKDGIIRTVEEVGGKVGGAHISPQRRSLTPWGPQTSVLFESRTGHPRISLLLRLPPLSVSLTPEVRCAVVGNVDSGKSTTLGVLTRGKQDHYVTFFISDLRAGALDDGRGRARVGLFRHKHEMETGRTSSVGMEVCIPTIFEFLALTF